jgi:hypothetical protein
MERRRTIDCRCTGWRGRSRTPLAANVARFDAKATPNTDAYARFNRLALELRPILRDALDRAVKVGALMSDTCAAWKRVHARW